MMDEKRNLEIVHDNSRYVHVIIQIKFSMHSSLSPPYFITYGHLLRHNPDQMKQGLQVQYKDPSKVALEGRTPTPTPSYQVCSSKNVLGETRIYSKLIKRPTQG